MNLSKHIFSQRGEDAKEEKYVFMQTGIIIPCFNEAKRLPGADFLNFLKENPDYFICFVNDGSRDDTLSVLNKLKTAAEGEPRQGRKNPKQIAILDLHPNRGKAEAVRNGILELLKQEDLKQVGFLDADLSTPLSEFKKLSDTMSANKKLQVVCGSRIRRMGATVERSAKRHYIGRVMATIISNMLELPFYDTQCGAKVFSRDICPIAFANSFRSKWLFDVEIFLRMKQQYSVQELCEIIMEYPLGCWTEIQDSKISLMDTLKIPFELLKISRAYRGNFFSKNQ